MSDIFIVAGQSNAVRQTRHQGIEEILAENQIEAEVVHSALGGTSLAANPDRVDWFPFDDGDEQTGELLAQLILDIDAKLAEDPNHKIAGILWVQGEADSKEGRSDQYLANLTQLHAVLRERYGQDFNFTVSTLTESMEWYVGDEYHLEVSQAQLDFAAAHDNATILDPDVSRAEQNQAKGRSKTRPVGA